jgi:hypothetical protein
MFLLGLALGLLAGMVAGWLLRANWKESAKPANPYGRKVRQFEWFTTWWTLPGSGHSYGLRSIDPGRLLAICARVNRGQSLTFKALCGKGKLLSRAELVRLREELVNREFATRNRDGSLSPTPTGRLFFKNWPVRQTHARLHAGAGGQRRLIRDAI